MRLKKYLLTVILLLPMQAIYAQYNNHVNQYCTRIGKHPEACYQYHESCPIIYGGIIITKDFGKSLNLDLGLKLENNWERTCTPFKSGFNTYFDIKLSHCKIDDYTSKSFLLGQIAIAPKIQYKKVSLDFGPFVAYSAAFYYEDDLAFEFEAESSGFKGGIMFGASVNIKRVDIGLHYDLEIVRQSKTTKDNNLCLTVGYRLKE